MQWLRALCLWRWQRYKRYTNISKNTSNIINVVTTQRCRCRANILMNTSIVANVTTMQRCKRCTFDSPGLTSESIVYPGLFVISEHNAVGVVPFCFPNSISPLIINYITLALVSSRNCVGIALLFQWMNFAI